MNLFYVIFFFFSTQVNNICINAHNNDGWDEINFKVISDPNLNTSEIIIQYENTAFEGELIFKDNISENVEVEFKYLFTYEPILISNIYNLFYFDEADFLLNFRKSYEFKINNLLVSATGISNNEEDILYNFLTSWEQQQQIFIGSEIFPHKFNKIWFLIKYFEWENKWISRIWALNIKFEGKKNQNNTFSVKNMLKREIVWNNVNHWLKYRTWSSFS